MPRTTHHVSSDDFHVSVAFTVSWKAPKPFSFLTRTPGAFSSLGRVLAPDQDVPGVPGIRKSCLGKHLRHSAEHIAYLPLLGMVLPLGKATGMVTPLGTALGAPTQL